MCGELAAAWDWTIYEWRLIGIMQEKRTLQFRYCMSLEFSEPVWKHQFALRMIPQTDDRQTISACRIDLKPECDYSDSVDSFGNRYIYGEIDRLHNEFCVEVSGEAAVRKDTQLACDNKMIELAPYRFPSQYTKAGDALKKYYRLHGLREGEGVLAFAARLLHQIYEDMEYVQGVTDIRTTAEEALAGKRGVCQDYAHIMLALCRIADIPSRYVVGMMQGEGYSHAWVEVCADGRWYGMDPTNDRIVDDTYIKISHGRDYQDCIVNRGTFRGNGMQTQHVKVVVTA